ncbi:elongin-B-like [Myzus persicae]|uniref:elongin-B-like n=1 Tax=Myzus persicae TaxID=13164 RepID=UPI000B935B47|nr:elongin-B-like [Myzus persicae]
MDVFMIIQRKNQTIFLDAKDNILVNKLKNKIGSIIKVVPSSLQLYYKDKIMDGTKTLSNCGLNSITAEALNPATIGLTLKLDNEEFEPLEIVPYP